VHSNETRQDKTRQPRPCGDLPALADEAGQNKTHQAIIIVASFRIAQSPTQFSPPSPHAMRLLTPRSLLLGHRRRNRPHHIPYTNDGVIS